jgi:hypothetical protein
MAGTHSRRRWHPGVGAGTGAQFFRTPSMRVHASLAPHPDPHDDVTAVPVGEDDQRRGIPDGQDVVGDALAEGDIGAGWGKLDDIELDEAGVEHGGGIRRSSCTSQTWRQRGPRGYSSRRQECCDWFTCSAICGKGSARPRRLSACPARRRGRGELTRRGGEVEEAGGLCSFEENGAIRARFNPPRTHMYRGHFGLKTWAWSVRGQTINWQSKEWQKRRVKVNEGKL